jgi:hypothetical protein
MTHVHPVPLSLAHLFVGAGGVAHVLETDGDLRRRFDWD